VACDYLRHVRRSKNLIANDLQIPVVCQKVAEQVQKYDREKGGRKKLQGSSTPPLIKFRPTGFRATPATRAMAADQRWRIQDCTDPAEWLRFASNAVEASIGGATQSVPAST
jgi:hypothetical protein